VFEIEDRTMDKVQNCDSYINIQFNSIYSRANLNSLEVNYKVSTGKKMGRVRSKKASENNNILIKIKIIKCKHKKISS
jgi:hypothetical protein